jgi:hypothetical protein
LGDEPKAAAAKAGKSKSQGKIALKTKDKGHKTQDKGHKTQDKGHKAKDSVDARG